MSLAEVKTNQPVKTQSSVRAQYIGILALLPLVYLLLVHWVGAYPIVIWDEGRLAVNAAEMEQNGKWLVTYFGGAPDLWNTKPPLIIWLEALSLRLFGYSETAFRLPAILSSVSTVGIIYWFTCRRLNTLWGAIFSVLVLVTTHGYNSFHTARTGDYDVLLTLLLTLATVSFFWYLEQGRRADFALVTLGLTLAALTKGVAGLFWLPAFGLYAISQGRLLWLLRRREVYVGMALALLTVAAYYFGRELQNPGYLQAVYDNELGGRLLTVLDQHQHPWFWYITNMYESRYMPWMLVFPVSLFLLWRFPSEAVERRFALLTGLVVASHLLVISSASTKLEWYDMPIYPVMAIVIGTSLGMVIGYALAAYGQIGRGAAATTVLLFCLVVFATPVLRVYNGIAEKHKWRHADAEVAYGFQTKAMVQQMPQITKYVMYTSVPYNSSMQYYSLAAARNYKHEVVPKYAAQIDELSPGDAVMVCGGQDQVAIAEKFETIPLVQYHGCMTVLLQRRR